MRLTTRIVVSCCLGSFCPLAVAQEPLRLDRVEDVAMLIPGSFGSGDVFRVDLETRWQPGQAPDATRDRIQVTLPDGRVLAFPLGEGASARSRRLSFAIPAEAIRNRLPGQVALNVVVADGTTGAARSNAVSLDVTAFPRPQVGSTPVDLGPFGWGTPLSSKNRILPRPGPDGLRFALIVVPEGPSPFYLSLTEITNAQAALRIKGYDARAGRSDEFQLESPEQPAIGLSPRVALAYLDALSQADPSRTAFRLPTLKEWYAAARAGSPERFWWGNEANRPDAANLLGPEPGLETDSTVSAVRSRFKPNPFGLMHTFGNVEEWVRLADEPARFGRVGGHFRSEPEDLQKEPNPVAPDTLGPDPFVGVRPAFSIDPDRFLDTIRQRLQVNARLREVQAGFDPLRATVTLRGRAAEPSDRRAADEALASFWNISAVENQIETPRSEPGELGRIVKVAGTPRRITPLGRPQVEIPVEVRWADPLPVTGSAWFVNTFSAGGVFSHRFLDGEPRASGRLLVVADEARLGQVDADGTTAVTVAISLGQPVDRPDDRAVVSNRFEFRLPRR